MEEDPPARIPANEVAVPVPGAAVTPMHRRGNGEGPILVLSSMKSPLPRGPLAALLLLAAACPASAQTQLREIVVTATRTESRASAVLSDTVVIEREQIEQGTGRSVAELLARHAGVQMAANGGLGKNSSVFIRGTEARHVLLLVDGVRVGSATSGQASFDNIALESIERIEVLKGPASALYGSDAIGGVIQIFTRRGREGMFPYASATLGGAGRRAAAAGLGGGQGLVSYSLGLQSLREKGFSATNPAAGRFSFNPDADGFSQDSLNASLDWRFAAGWKADARIMYSKGRNHYDSGPGEFDTQADVATGLGVVGVEAQLRPAWKSRLSLATSTDRSTNFTGRPATRFDTRQDQWSWTHEVATRAGKVLAGAERLAQEVDSTSAYAVTRRSTGSVFAGLSGEEGPHSWQLNVRHDDDSQFGGAATGLTAYGYRLTPALRLHGSYGTAFKAPSFNSLYFPGFGNPDLRPERARNAELGLRHELGSGELTLVRFDNRVRDLIAFVGPNFQPVNVDRARIRGWTLGYQARRGAWGVQAALDLLDARNVQTGARLPRRAEQQLTASLDYAPAGWKFGSTLLAASDRFDNAANTVRLGGFATLDLYAQRALSRDWSLQARLNNLADKQYQTAQGYNQPGRAAYLTLRYWPQ